MNQVLKMFQSAGPEAFSKMACQMAPYFSTISPLISELDVNSCIVQLRFAKDVTNHLGTVHAIAMCNAAELAAGMMTNVSIPAGARWIPKGMTIEYLAPFVDGDTCAISTPYRQPQRRTRALNDLTQTGLAGSM